MCKVSVDPCLQQTDAFLHLLAALLSFPTLSAPVLALLGNSFTFGKEKGYLFCSISNWVCKENSHYLDTECYGNGCLGESCTEDAEAESQFLAVSGRKQTLSLSLRRPRWEHKGICSHLRENLLSHYTCKCRWFLKIRFLSCVAEILKLSKLVRFMLGEGVMCWVSHITSSLS